VLDEAPEDESVELPEALSGVDDHRSVLGPVARRVTAFGVDRWHVNVHPSTERQGSRQLLQGLCRSPGMDLVQGNVPPLVTSYWHRFGANKRKLSPSAARLIEPVPD
jgi:hypothetical protein